jgi:histone deacetylase 11
VKPAIVYSRHYDIRFFGLERLHPFDSRKYGRAWAVLREEFGRKLLENLVAPGKPSGDDDLRSVHTEAYLATSLRSPAYLARVLEVPPVARLPRWVVDWRVLRPMRWATAGTVLAAREALRTGMAVNLAGGYHHASRDRGEGFSVYSDIGTAITVLRNERLLGPHDRVVYIDLDAHQGNGVARVFVDDPRVFLFDVYNEFIYPRDAHARRRIDRDLPIPPGYDDGRYLSLLRAELPPFLDALSKSKLPALAVYNAGTDVFAGDPLGNLNVSAEGVLARDQFVLQALSERGIPWVMLPSGGYTRESYKLLARTVSWSLRTWDGGSGRAGALAPSAVP